MLLTAKCVIGHCVYTFHVLCTTTKPQHCLVLTNMLRSPPPPYIKKNIYYAMSVLDWSTLHYDDPKKAFERIIWGFYTLRNWRLMLTRLSACPPSLSIDAAVLGWQIDVPQGKSSSNGSQISFGQSGGNYVVCKGFPHLRLRRARLAYYPVIATTVLQGEFQMTLSDLTFIKTPTFLCLDCHCFGLRPAMILQHQIRGSKSKIWAIQIGEVENFCTLS